MSGAVVVRYKCRCMTEEASVDVRYRGEHEDVKDWIVVVMSAALIEDHKRRSPLCRSTTMEYVKVPMPENSPMLGGRPVVN